VEADRPCARLATLLGLYFAFSFPAVYTAMALVEVSAKSSGYVLDQEGVGGRSPYYGGTSATIQNQMELIKSRSILTEALQQTDLDLSVEPGYFPALARPGPFAIRGTWRRFRSESARGRNTPGVARKFRLRSSNPRVQARKPISTGGRRAWHLRFLCGRHRRDFSRCCRPAHAGKTADGATSCSTSANYRPARHPVFRPATSLAEGS